MGISGLGGLEVHNQGQSSSSSSPGPGLELRKSAQFDVFLNHRGPDVKRTFLSHLDAALRRVGCEPFLDADALVEGHRAFDCIKEALDGALVHVAIFSPRYAESKYCLDELYDMLLIPVFYNVEPENLRWSDNEEGPFAKGFNHHMQRGRLEDVVKWKGVLMKAAAITGFRFAGNDNEATLVDKVVAAVVRKLPTSHTILPAPHRVGLKKTCMDVVSMLHSMGDNVGVLGICGMGGIGKTTLAREVYNQEQGRYENKCFLENVKDTKASGMRDLQMRMVGDLFGKELRKMCKDHSCWWEIMQKKKVLLVVDDISMREQFVELIPNVKHLCRGSRVLITSHESDVLKRIMACVPQPQRNPYVVPELNFENSLELFITHAFQKKRLSDVDATFHDKAKRVTTACGGVPLALEVMGGFLANKENELECWAEAIDVLRMEGETMTKLQISYDGLRSDDEKRMFVDIACIMLGHSKYKALEVWSMVGYRKPSASLRKLIDKCLVKLDGEGRLEMHDLLRDMGRNVVMERVGGKVEMQTHIWEAEMARRVLQKRNDSNEDVRALSLVGSQSNSIVCKAEAYAKMKELRYLLLNDGCEVNGDFSEWSEELRWLQWRYFPHRELPLSLKLHNLVVLDLSHSVHLTRLWAKDIEVEFPCNELRMLILCKCKMLEEVPQHIGKSITRLKVLDLEECSSLASLPDSLEDLAELQHLNLAECSKLRRLPNLQCVESLQKLNLQGCVSLTELPRSISEMSYLEDLNLTSCQLIANLPPVHGLVNLRVLVMSKTAVVELPWQFGQLCNLEKAYFVGCKRLVQLPASIGNLSKLERLWLDGCELIRELPPSICRLTMLKWLDMSDTTLEGLPKEFGQLGSLEKAYFVGCKRLVQLPASIGSLSKLEDLGLNGCELIQELPPFVCKLTKLKVLRLEGMAWEEVPDVVGLLSSLEEVYFSFCKCMTRFPEFFWELSNLEVLHLDGCDLLQKLPPSICLLKKLREVCLDFMALEDLPEEFGQLENLEQADFEDCNMLQRLCESFGCLGKLKKLKLKGCNRLIQLPESFSNLSCLEWLDLRGCSLLQEYPESCMRLFILVDEDVKM